VKVPRWQIFGDILGPTFPASCAQHISDLHSKLALWPYYVQKYMVDIQSAAAEIRRGKKKEELECGPIPNVMATLPNLVGADCSTPQSLADAHY